MCCFKGGLLFCRNLRNPALAQFQHRLTYIMSVNFIHIITFIFRSLLASETMQKYDKARVFLDEDFTAVDKFTVS